MTVALWAAAYDTLKLCHDELLALGQPPVACVQNEARGVSLCFNLDYTYPLGHRKYALATSTKVS